MRGRRQRKRREREQFSAIVAEMIEFAQSCKGRYIPSPNSYGPAGRHVPDPYVKVSNEVVKVSSEYVMDHITVCLKCQKPIRRRAEPSRFTEWMIEPFLIQEQP